MVRFNVHKKNFVDFLKTIL